MVFQTHRHGLLCPRCDDPLKSENSLGVWTDLCSHCGGIWLDANEIAPLMERARSEEVELEGVLVAPGSDAPGGPGHEKQTPLCPVCQVEIPEAPYSFGSGVTVNTCSRCQGLWLDQGEFSAIFEFLKRERAFYF